MTADPTTTVPAATTADAALVRQFRASLVVLAVLTWIGTAVELAMLRHWNSATQLVPWFVLAVLAVAIAAYVVRPTRTVVRAVRVVAIAAALGAAWGAKEHIEANLVAGAASPVLGDRWGSFSTVYRWWLAATGGAGDTPPLAPGFLALTGIILALATLGRYGDLGWLERLARARRTRPDRRG